MSDLAGPAKNPNPEQSRQHWEEKQKLRDLLYALELDNDELEAERDAQAQRIEELTAFVRMIAEAEEDPYIGNHDSLFRRRFRQKAHALLAEEAQGGK